MTAHVPHTSKHLHSGMIAFNIIIFHFIFRFNELLLAALAMLAQTSTAVETMAKGSSFQIKKQNHTDLLKQYLLILNKINMLQIHYIFGSNIKNTCFCNFLKKKLNKSYCNLLKPKQNFEK